MPTNMEVELFKIEKEKLKVFKAMLGELNQIRQDLNRFVNNHETIYRHEIDPT